MKSTLLVACAALSVAACERDELPRYEPGTPQTQAERAGEEVQSEAVEAQRELEKDRAEFIQGIQDRLGDIERDMDELGDRTENVKFEAKQGVSSALAEVEKARTKLNRDIERMQNASAREWEELKDAVEDDVDALEDAVEKASDSVSEPADTIEQQGQRGAPPEMSTEK